MRRLPVWPTNTQVLAQVCLSIAMPLVLLFLQVAIDRIVEKNEERPVAVR